MVGKSVSDTSTLFLGRACADDANMMPAGPGKTSGVFGHVPQILRLATAGTRRRQCAAKPPEKQFR
jgi:hypothetical protein